MTVDERPGPEPDEGPVEARPERPRERRTLDRVLVDEGPLAPPRALELLRPLAREIDRLHARSRVHGAVRPWLVVVEPGVGDVKEVVTLGPGMPSDGASSRGSPVYAVDGPAGATSSGAERDAAYRSPQLLAGEDARPLDDQYALGVIAYELLTGASPFEAGTGASPARRPIPPGERSMELPAAVEAVLLAQLSAAPASRFATAMQLVRELERAASPNQASARPASIADLLGSPTALPTFRRVPAGLGARRLALAELPDVTRAPRGRARPRRVRRNDYPDLGLPGVWVAVIVAVLCSVYLLPGFYMYVLPAYRTLHGLAVALFPDLFGPG